MFKASSFIRAAMLCAVIAAMSCECAFAMGVGAVDPSYEQTHINRINRERRSAGLSELTLSTALCKAAQLRAAELYTYKFDHERPDGSGPETAIEGWAGNALAWRGIGENIAKGNKDSNDAMNAWMASPAHKANILHEKYKYVGIATYLDNNGLLWWVQLFSFDRPSDDTNYRPGTAIIDFPAGKHKGNNAYVDIDITDLYSSEALGSLKTFVKDSQNKSNLTMVITLFSHCSYASTFLKEMSRSEFFKDAKNIDIIFQGYNLRDAVQNMVNKSAPEIKNWSNAKLFYGPIAVYSGYTDMLFGRGTEEVTDGVFWNNVTFPSKTPLIMLYKNDEIVCYSCGLENDTTLVPAWEEKIKAILAASEKDPQTPGKDDDDPQNPGNDDDNPQNPGRDDPNTIIGENGKTTTLASPREEAQSLGQNVKNMLVERAPGDPASGLIIRGLTYRQGFNDPAVSKPGEEYIMLNGGEKSALDILLLDPTSTTPENMNYAEGYDNTEVTAEFFTRDNRSLFARTAAISGGAFRIPLDTAAIAKAAKELGISAASELSALSEEGYREIYKMKITAAEQIPGFPIERTLSVSTTGNNNGGTSDTTGGSGGGGGCTASGLGAVIAAVAALALRARGKAK